MKKVLENSVKKVLNKKEQKAIVGGTCYDPETGQPEGKPVHCRVNGKPAFVCPHLCD